MKNIQKGKKMGIDDPVTRVGNKIWGAEMGSKIEGMRGAGGDLEWVWIKSGSICHVIISGTFLIY